MIRPLRTRHRRTFQVLAVLLPSLFLLALWLRQPVPAGNGAVPGLDPLVGGEVIWSRDDLWPGRKALTTLHRTPSNEVFLRLRDEGAPRADVLVYWTPESPAKSGPGEAGGPLPGDARLLGPLDGGTPLVLLQGLRGLSGRLVQFSLADHEIVAVSSPFTVGRN